MCLAAARRYVGNVNSIAVPAAVVINIRSSVIVLIFVVDDQCAVDLKDRRFPSRAGIQRAIVRITAGRAVAARIQVLHFYRSVLLDRDRTAADIHGIGRGFIVGKGRKIDLALRRIFVTNTAAFADAGILGNKRPAVIQTEVHRSFIAYVDAAAINRGMVADNRAAVKVNDRLISLDINAAAQLCRMIAADCTAGHVQQALSR